MSSDNFFQKLINIKKAQKRKKGREPHFPDIIPLIDLN